MSDAILAAVQQSQLKTDLPRVQVGDTVDVHVRIIEGSKERVQVFTGVVIKIQNGGLEETFTVRRIVANEGVERTFPFHSPKVAKIEVKRQGDARRAKLYYLRDRVGKKRRLRDRRRGLGSAVATATVVGDKALDQSAQGAENPEKAQAKRDDAQPVQEEVAST